MQKHLRYYLMFLLLSFAAISAKAQSASFTASTTSGCKPLVVYFTNTSDSATSYFWNFGDGVTSVFTSPSTTYSSPGSYSVVLVAYRGILTDTARMTITVNDTPNVHFNVDPSNVCPGIPTTFTDSSALNDTGSGTYTWNFGDGTGGAGTPVLHAYLIPGTKNVTLTVTNAAGCSSTLVLAAIVNVYTPPTPSFAASTYFCYPPANVTISNTSFGTATLNYNWNFGDGGTLATTSTSTNHTYTSTGLFSIKLIVTDGNGCIDSLLKTNYIAVGTLAAGFTSSRACIFAPDSFTNTSTTHSSSSWDFGDGGSSTLENPTHTFTSAGTHTVMLIVSDGTCSDTISQNITVYPQPTADFTMSPPEPCPNPVAITFTGSVPTGSSVTWSYGDHNYGTGSTSTHTYVDNGIFVDTMFVTDTNGCRDTVVHSDTIRDIHFELTVSYSGYCAPDSTTWGITAVTTTIPSSGTYPFSIVSYHWTFGDGSTSDSAAPSHIYTTSNPDFHVNCTITTSNGCTADATSGISVGFPDSVTGSVTPTHVCYGTPMIFTSHIVSGSPSYYWWYFGTTSPYSTTDTSVTYTFPAPGSYIVKVEGFDHGCHDSQYTLPVTIIIDSPMAVMGITYSCINPDSVVFMNNSVGADSFKWIFPTATYYSDSFSHVFPALDTYTVLLTTYDSVSGCRDTAKKLVSLFSPSAYFTATDTTLCLGDTGYFRPYFDSLDCITNYYWYIDNTFTWSSSPPTPFTFWHPFNATSVDTVALVIKDAHGCRDTVIHKVYVAKPVADFTFSQLSGCGPLIDTLIDLSTHQSYTSICSYLWSFGDGVSVTTGTSPVIHSYIHEGTDTVQEIVTDSYGCKDTFTAATLIHIFNPNATIFCSDTFPCVGMQVRFSYTSTDTLSGSFWMFGDGGTSSLDSATHFYTDTGTYRVKLIVTDIHGCTDTVNYRYAMKITEPSASFYMADSIAICPPFAVNFINTSIGADSYYWIFGDGNTSPYDTGVTNTYNTSGYFTVQLIDSTIHGCKDTAYGHVTVFGYTGSFTYPDTLCKYGAVRFTSPTTHVDSIIWDFGDGNTLAGGRADSIYLYHYDRPGSFVPKLILISHLGTGCISTSHGSDSIKVDSVGAAFNILPDSVCPYVSVTFIDTSSSYFSVISIHRWQFTPGDTALTDTTYRSFRTSGSHSVTLISGDAWGCKDTASNNVYVYGDSLTVSGNTGMCFGDTVTLHASGDTSYSWSAAGTLSCPTCDTVKAYPAITTTYTVTGISDHGCHDTATVTDTVHFIPYVAAISGADTVCVGSVLVLSDSTPGGSWLVSNKTIDTLVTAGHVRGVSAGTDTVYYSVSNHCGSDTASKIVHVRPLPDSITRSDTAVCVGSEMLLTDSTSGGLWSSSDTTVAKVGTATGIVTGVKSGTADITYTLVATGCYVSTVIIVNPLPSIITGERHVCVNDTATLSDSIAHGTWSSNDTAIAEINDTTGTVTGISFGLTIVTYTLPTGCLDTFAVRIDSLPHISGLTSECVGVTDTLTGTPTGTWSSSDTSFATVGSSTGYVYGHAYGTATITFTASGTGCYSRISDTVHALPYLSPISGADTLCPGATDTLSDTPGGGTWSSSVLTVAYVTLLDTTRTIVTGVNPGITEIYYSFTGGYGCSATDSLTLTVDSLPVILPFNIQDTICVYDSFALTHWDTGTWSSSNPSIAYISSSGYIVTLSPGLDTLTYTVNNTHGCSTTLWFILNVLPLPPLPLPITGIDTICVLGATTTMTSAGGIYWTSGDPTIATIDSSTGIVTGVSAGTTTITYTDSSAGGCRSYVTEPITVLSPYILTPISGSSTVCLGSVNPYIDTSAGGVWNISNPTIAIIDLTGNLTATSSGIDTISYNVTNYCGIFSTSFVVTVDTIPMLPPITGFPGVCSGDSTILSDSLEGGTWSSSNTAIATVDSLSGVVTGVAGGTATITYTFANVCGAWSVTFPVIVNMPVFITSNFIVACQTLGVDSPIVIGTEGGGTTFGHSGIITDSSGCIIVCDSTVVRYYGNGVARSIFAWVVTGGTIITNYGDSIDVAWYAAGTVGSVSLFDTFSHCMGMATACIHVIQKPHAAFSASEVSVCANGVVTFRDMSTYDYSLPITSWLWNFGDGTYSSVENPAPHTFSAVGTVTVTLVVRNGCGCTDTFSMVIMVSKFPGPVIQCPSIACENQISSYSVPLGCGLYNWSVIGGTIMTGFGTNIITVQWNLVDSGGFGYVSIVEPCDDMCDDTTTIRVPVILLGATISGPSTACVGTQYEYSLPFWPTTRYMWGVVGDPAAIDTAHIQYEATIEFTTPGVETIHAWYQNEIALCGGNVFKTVQVYAPTTITGATTVCQNSTENYVIGGGFSGDWTIIDPIGGITTASSVNTNAIYFSMAGNYTINVSGSFCANPLSIHVNGAPPVDTLKGADTVCLNRVYTYSAKNDISGDIFSWKAIGGQVSPASGSDTVSVIWTSSGTKQLLVARQNMIAPYCYGNFDTMNIVTEQINPNITGDPYPCSNASRFYTGNYTRGDVYNWTIYPDSIGSVTNGNHDTAMTVLWNNMVDSTPVAIVLTVQKCDSIVHDTLHVTVIPSPKISLTSSASPECPLTPVTFTASPGDSVYIWDFGDGGRRLTSFTNIVSHTYPQNYTIGNMYYLVVLNAIAGSSIGCPAIGGNEFNEVIKPGPPVEMGGGQDTCGSPLNTFIIYTDTNAGAVSYQWYKNDTLIPGAIDSTYIGDTAIGYTFIVTAADGCSSLSQVGYGIYRACPIPYAWPRDTSLGGRDTCELTATVSVDCQTVTLTAPSWVTSPTWGRFDGHTGAWYYFASGYTVTYTLSGLGTDEIYLNSGFCYTSTLYASVGILPKFYNGWRCGPGGIDTAILYDNSDRTPTYHIDSITWSQGSTILGYGSGVYVPVSDTAADTISEMVSGHIDWISGGGRFNCGTTQVIIAPPKPHAAFTDSVAPICEGIPVQFVPLSTSGMVGFRWDFGDSSDILLEYPQRTYTWNTTTFKEFTVKLTITDSIGCTADTTGIVQIFADQLAGGMAIPYFALCENSLPFGVNSFITPFGTISSYIWSTGDTTLVPTLNVYKTGAYWVTAYDIHQCRFTPVDAENVKVIIVPPAQIVGQHNYCFGSTVSLSGYAGDSIMYQWYLDAIPGDTTAGITSSGLSVADHYYQLVLGVTDSGTTCYDTSAVDTIHIYPNPPAPVITETLASCSPYSLLLTASDSSTGFYNWSNGSSGATDLVYNGGYYRVWFTNLYGCGSYADTSVPLSPDIYSPYFPTGCYSFCIDQLPITLYGVPDVSFTSWEWDLYGMPALSGTGYMLPFAIPGPGTYRWQLSNGLCNDTIAEFDVNVIPCTECPQAFTASLTCEPLNPASYVIHFTLYPSIPGTTFIIGTDDGPITPFSATMPGGPYSATFTFTTLAVPAPDSITIMVEMTLPTGDKCYQKLK